MGVAPLLGCGLPGLPGAGAGSWHEEGSWRPSQLVGPQGKLSAGSPLHSRLLPCPPYPCMLGGFAWALRMALWAPRQTPYAPEEMSQCFHCRC